MCSPDRASRAVSLRLTLCARQNVRSFCFIRQMLATLLKDFSLQTEYLSRPMQDRRKRAAEKGDGHGKANGTGQAKGDRGQNRQADFAYRLVVRGDDQASVRGSADTVQRVSTV